MSKRFTDTEKWRKDFIKGLPPAYKLLWIYILDDCDHAGIWHYDIDVASIRIGMEVTGEEALKHFEGRIYPFDNGKKWLIQDFIKFQYGNLNSGNRVHESVIKRLKKYDLFERVSKGLTKGLENPSERVKDKDKDKDKDKGKDKGKDSAPKFKEGDRPYDASCYLKEKILDNNHRASVPDDNPADMENWSIEMDRLHRLGPPGGDSGYSWEEIRDIIDWCQDNDFWQPNILSAGKLREKIITLENQMKADDKNTPDTADDRYRKAQAEEEAENV